MAGLELRTAPKGHCVNRTPIVHVIGPRADASSVEAAPSVTARLGAALNLTGEVQDDGLPRDSRLLTSWRKISGPGAVTFSSTDTASTRATFSAPGDYELELTGNDGEKSGSIRVKVAVASAVLTGG